MNRTIKINESELKSLIVESIINILIESESKDNKRKDWEVYVDGSLDKHFTEGSKKWKKEPMVGWRWYAGGTTFRVTDIDDNKVYAIQESYKRNINEGISMESKPRTQKEMEPYIKISDDIEADSEYGGESDIIYASAFGYQMQGSVDSNGIITPVVAYTTDNGEHFDSDLHGKLSLDGFRKYAALYFAEWAREDEDNR